MVAFGKKMGGGRRAAARSASPLIAVFTTLQQSHTAELVDISATGARLRGEHLPEAADELLLSIDKVRAFGTVVWSDADECGVEFDCPLSPADEQLLSERVAAARGLPPEIKLALDNWAVGCGR